MCRLEMLVKTCGSWESE